MNSSVMSTYKRLPVAFESGSGAWLIDQHGQRYLDALSGLAVCGLGHAHAAVQQAVAHQAGQLLHTSNLYEIPLQERLARKLCDLSGLDRVFFGNSGAEANEAAIKLCRKYAHQKGITEPVIVVMQGSFHGRTMATISATGNAKISDGFSPLLAGFEHIPYDNIDALRELADSDSQIVAVMLEPILGEGGIVIPTPGYLPSIAEICRQNDYLLVLDEIQTGMCRTGKWFAWQHESIKPDIMTLAKSLGNGVPIGACLANEKASQAMLPGSHGSTFGGNQLASSAALAVIDFMLDNNLEQRAAVLGRDMLEQFSGTLAGLAGVKDIRGAGLMIGIELHEDCTELVELALAQHLLINVTVGNVVRLLPHLIISEAEAEQIVDTVCGLIQKFLCG